jgi:hypothetical protein
MPIARAIANCRIITLPLGAFFFLITSAITQARSFTAISLEDNEPVVSGTSVGASGTIHTRICCFGDVYLAARQALLGMVVPQNHRGGVVLEGLSTSPIA